MPLSTVCVKVCDKSMILCDFSMDRSKLRSVFKLGALRATYLGETGSKPAGKCSEEARSCELLLPSFFAL